MPKRVVTSDDRSHDPEQLGHVLVTCSVTWSRDSRVIVVVDPTTLRMELMREIGVPPMKSN